MGKWATTVEEQVEQLENRGLTFDYPREKVKEILMDIGYYRLGFYWYRFETDEDHRFQAGAKFSDAVRLYYLDVDLRNVLLKCLNRIEVNFRTRLVYTVSNHYKDSPTWFSDPRVVDKAFLEKFDHYYNDQFKKNNKPIQAHHKKHINDKYAPAWKTLEFFSLGTIITLFKSLKEDALKEKIARIYGIRTLRKFIDHMHTLLFIRNTCAHGGLLYDLSLPKGVSFISELNFERKNNQTLDAAIRLIIFYLGNISKNRQNELISRINKVLDNTDFSPAVRSIIQSKIRINSFGVYKD